MDKEKDRLQITFSPEFFDSPGMQKFIADSGKPKEEIMRAFIAAARAAEESGKIGADAMIVYGEVLSALLGDPDATVEVNPAGDNEIEVVGTIGITKSKQN